MVTPRSVAPVDEDRPLLRHLFRFFLAHGAAQQVCTAERIPGQHLRDLHDLLLVQDDAVGFLEHRLQVRMEVVDLGLVARVLALYEVVDHAGLQGSGAKQCDQGNEVVELIRFQPFDQVTHAARFELEHRSRRRALQQAKGPGVFERNAADIDELGACGLVDDPHGPVDDRQCLQAEEIELDETYSLDVVLVELRDDVRSAFFAIKRCKSRQLTGRDNYAARVLAGIAHQALQRSREIDDSRDFLVVAVHLGKLVGLGERPLERHADLERHLFGDPVDKAVRLAEDSPGVANDRPRRHRAKGYDLRDALPPVSFRHVVDDPVPALHAEVHIEVGHRYALGIQEALEKQLVRQRVQVGDPQHPRDQRAGAGPASRPHRHAVLARPADKVGNDQEVTREAHVAND